MRRVAEEATKTRASESAVRTVPPAFEGRRLRVPPTSWAWPPGWPAVAAMAAIRMRMKTRIRAPGVYSVTGSGRFSTLFMQVEGGPVQTCTGKRVRALQTVGLGDGRGASCTDGDTRRMPAASWHGKLKACS